MSCARCTLWSSRRRVRRVRRRPRVAAGTHARHHTASRRPHSAIVASHLRRDRARPGYVGAGTELSSATSAPGRGPSPPHLHRDRALSRPARPTPRLIPPRAADAGPYVGFRRTTASHLSPPVAVSPRVVGPLGATCYGGRLHCPTWAVRTRCRLQLGYSKYSPWGTLSTHRGVL